MAGASQHLRATLRDTQFPLAVSLVAFSCCWRSVFRSSFHGLVLSGVGAEKALGWVAIFMFDASCADVP
jgi:hypothetical protein